MVVYSIECSDCGENRVGREVGDDISPYFDECPECGSDEFTVAGDRSDGAGPERA
jgi:Zn finger protein HypA/HybF involved in hydrogenase expression